MLCLNCNRALEDGQERCPDCGEEINPEATANAMAAAAEALARLDPGSLEELRAAASLAETAEDFANAIMIGDCPSCGSEEVLSGEHDPDIDNPCIATCHDCGKVWCTECRELLTPGEFCTHHDTCPAMEDLDLPDELLDEPDADVAAVLAALADQSGKAYPRATVDAGIEAREAITPHLLRILRDSLEDPDTFARNAWDMRPTYAVLLLGYFRETRAHDYLVRILRLPGEKAFDVFGDSITEDFAAMLVRTYPGSAEGLFQLIRDDNANTFCRSAGFSALAVLVAEGRADRGTVLQVVAEILAGALANGDCETATLCADAAYDLHPRELMPQIATAYGLGLVDTFVVSREEITRVFERDVEGHLQQQLEAQRERHPEDFHSWVSWWAMYRESRTPSLPAGSGRPAASLNRGSKPKKSAAAKKKKRAREDRRRGRRRKK